eukprot:3117842-Amphidinium_carterae.1
MRPLDRTQSIPSSNDYWKPNPEPSQPRKISWRISVSTLRQVFMSRAPCALHTFKEQLYSSAVGSSLGARRWCTEPISDGSRTLRNRMEGLRTQLLGVFLKPPLEQVRCSISSQQVWTPRLQAYHLQEASLRDVTLADHI